jgi:Fic family protein
MSLSYQVDNDAIRLLKRVDALTGQQVRLLSSIDTARRDVIHRQARISTIGATTRIENAVLTDAQIDWIDTELCTDGRPTAFAARRRFLQSKLSKDRERSLEEVAGCREMLTLVYSEGPELFPLTEATIRGLHHQLLKYHAPASHHLGRYKLVSNSVVERDGMTGKERTVLKTSDPGPLTETAMNDLLSWYNETLPDHPWPVAVATEFVFRFLACHPFQDGNGRLGRALFLLTLMQSSDTNFQQVVPFLAIDRFIEKRRPEYYAVLARTGSAYHQDSTKYNIPLFLRFMSNVTLEALDVISFYVEREERIRALPEAAHAVLQCFKERPEQRLTPKDIRALTELPPRTATRVLGTLLEYGLLQRYGKGAGTRYQLVF